MNPPHSIPDRINYIQNLFLSVQDYVRLNTDLTDIIKYLEIEPPEFRSIAYESASMELGFKNLVQEKNLINWKIFFQCSLPAHSFHMQIGLGWAFAKLEISPTPYLDQLHPFFKTMVFDGIGYYYALYKGRNTVKNQSIPNEIELHNLPGFDQGVGRRLWYISKGDVYQLNDLIQKYDEMRHADLWRGIGIACGYVGGCDELKLEQLLSSAKKFEESFRKGVSLAVISRSQSKSINNDIELASQIVCGRPVNTVVKEFAGSENELKDYKMY